MLIAWEQTALRLTHLKFSISWHVLECIIYIYTYYTYIHCTQYYGNTISIFYWMFYDIISQAQRTYPCQIIHHFTVLYRFLIFRKLLLKVHRHSTRFHQDLEGYQIDAFFLAIQYLHKLLIYFSFNLQFHILFGSGASDLNRTLLNLVQLLLQYLSLSQLETAPRLGIHVGSCHFGQLWRQGSLWTQFWKNQLHRHCCGRDVAINYEIKIPLTLHVAGVDQHIQGSQHLEAALAAWADKTTRPQDPKESLPWLPCPKRRNDSVQDIQDNKLRRLGRKAKVWISLFLDRSISSRSRWIYETCRVLAPSAADKMHSVKRSVCYAVEDFPNCEIWLSTTILIQYPALKLTCMKHTKRI